jgi:hypothetical protein
MAASSRCADQSSTLVPGLKKPATIAYALTAVVIAALPGGPETDVVACDQHEASCQPVIEHAAA